MHKRNKERKRNQKLECSRYAHYIIEANIIILNWQRPLWEED
jgi:hypothetical protein